MESLEEKHAALDEDPMAIDVFKDGAATLTGRQDWEGLEAYYLRQLRRIDDLDEDEVKYHLWHQLGQIYELRLEEPAKAMQAYHVAYSLDPDDEELRDKILALEEQAGL
ncbi:MAG: hypothetical protein ACOC9W_04980 [Persicimonas sp.]